MAKVGITAQLNTGYLTQDLATNDNLFFRSSAAVSPVKAFELPARGMAGQPDRSVQPQPVPHHRPESARRRCAAIITASGPWPAIRSARCRTPRSATCSAARPATPTRWPCWTPTARSGPHRVFVLGALRPGQPPRVRPLPAAGAQAVAGAGVARYTGRPDAYRSWDDVPHGRLAAVLRLDRRRPGPGRARGVSSATTGRKGFARGWSLPGYDDSGWLQLALSGRPAGLRPAAGRQVAVDAEDVHRRRGTGRAGSICRWPRLCRQHGAGVRQRHAAGRGRPAIPHRLGLGTVRRHRRSAARAGRSPSPCVSRPTTAPRARSSSRRRRPRTFPRPIRG